MALRTAVMVAQMNWPQEKAQRAAVASDLQLLVGEVRSASAAVKREVQVGGGRLTCSGLALVAWRSCLSSLFVTPC